ncbi:MAG: hypothetical protein QM667_09385 [Asticcacaulis sp.]
MTAPLRTLLLTGVLCGAFATFSAAQTPPVLTDKTPAAADKKPLSAAEATQCRAVAEVLRDRQYELMDSLLVRVERSPNLSPEALANTQKTVRETEAAMKTAEGHVERFIFAAVPARAVKATVGKSPEADLQKRLGDCLKQAPIVAIN